MCVNSPEFGVERQTTGCELVIRIEINKIKSYFFLKVSEEFVI
jgi:hypothetical protein